MFGSPVSGSGLTFGKVLGGISKALGVANQIIPLYKEAKPMINNAKTIFSVLKNIKPGSSSNDANIIKTVPEATVIEKQTDTQTNNDNTPVFFQ